MASWGITAWVQDKISREEEVVDDAAARELATTWWANNSSLTQICIWSERGGNRSLEAMEVRMPDGEIQDLAREIHRGENPFAVAQRTLREMERQDRGRRIFLPSDLMRG